MTPAEVAAKFSPVLHIHTEQRDTSYQFACHELIRPGHRDARPGESVTCEGCKRLLWKIRGDYTYSGRRRMATITGDTHS